MHSALRSILAEIFGRHPFNKPFSIFFNTLLTWPRAKPQGEQPPLAELCWLHCILELPTMKNIHTTSKLVYQEQCFLYLFTRSKAFFWSFPIAIR